MNEINLDNIKTLYERVCNSHDKIADFRAKLLALLPIASGAGIFFLVGDKKLAEAAIPHLFPVGIFGALITIGLFFYELRGIQKCRGLIVCARKLEKELLSGSLCEYGAFNFRQKAVLGGSVGAVGAALIIYPTVIGGWIYISAIGLINSNMLNINAVWFFFGALVLSSIFGFLMNK